MHAEDSQKEPLLDLSILLCQILELLNNLMWSLSKESGARIPKWACP